MDESRADVSRGGRYAKMCSNSLMKLDGQGGLRMKRIVRLGSSAARIWRCHTRSTHVLAPPALGVPNLRNAFLRSPPFSLATPLEPLHAFEVGFEFGIIHMQTK